MIGESDQSLEILGLRFWPFDMVPDLSGPLLWADRAELLKQLNRLLRTLRSHRANSLHLLWADFGSGKTHTLLYLRQLATAGPQGAVLPVYAALPRGIRSFVDVYRAIVRALDINILEQAYANSLRRLGRDDLDQRLRGSWPQVAYALRGLHMGSETQKRIALDWLLAEPAVSPRDLSQISVTCKIRSPEDAVMALATLVRLLQLGGYQRVLFMIDEFQRIGVLRRNMQDDINAALHSFFNTSPPATSLLLCFSFGERTNMKRYLNDELISRADPSGLAIPALSPAEGVTFVDDLMHAAAIPGIEPPVDADVTPFVVDLIGQLTVITPRRLMKAAGQVLSEGKLDMEDGVIGRITRPYAASILTPAVLAQIAGDSEQE